MTIMDVLILLGLILIIFGCIFYFIAIIMERHYDRKLWELKQDENRKEYKR
jgi:tellurite resistance protein TehA-like permease